jgi:two-component system, chemotaxis family, sensor kinase CheA
MDLSNYLEIFIEESKDHLQAMNQELLKLEAEPGNLAIINEIFRSAHTLKGMAGSMGYEDLASLTHEMENVLDLLRNSKLTITSPIMDVIFQCVDFIERMVDSIENGGDGTEDVKDIVLQLTKIQDSSTANNPYSSETVDEVAATVEMAIDEYQSSVISEARKEGNKLYQIKVVLDENCLMKSVRAYMVFQTVEELGSIIQTVPAVEQIEEDDFGDSFTLLVISVNEAEEMQKHILNVSEVKTVMIDERADEGSKSIENNGDGNESKTIKNSERAKKKEDVDTTKKKPKSKSIRVDIDKLDQLMNLFSELIIDRGRLEQISRQADLSDLTETVEHMTRISTDLQGLILNMRMVPVEQVFNRFPRMIRDLAKDLNKKVQLVIEGADTELDRTVIDEIGDPLIHLLRNALDHGLEAPEERAASGKNEEGKLLLKAHHGGNHVFIEVADDGKGIDREKVLAKAIERGVVEQEEANTLTDQQVFALIFSSGFSTANEISDISGRGVGLDVVKTKIESLGGVITIDSIPGAGSTFRIQLPLTLSIIYSMLVKVEDETYAIPFNSIVEITTIQNNHISTLHGQRVIQFRGQVVPLVYLAEEFKVPSSKLNETDKQQLHLVIVRKGNETIGLVVDTVIGQQEVVLKSLGGFLTNLHAISGATILGNGEVALIIDSNQFF